MEMAVGVPMTKMRGGNRTDRAGRKVNKQTKGTKFRQQKKSDKNRDNVVTENGLNDGR